MNITQAQYFDLLGETYIIATIDGQEVTVPPDVDNRHYAEILKQVEEGTLTIKDAD
tara:strand:+ start:608 stop:775 length:168 start_codon:yes stop_codon:yes gene_type:complete